MKTNNPKVLQRKRKEWFRFGIQILFFFLIPSVYSAAFTGIKNSVVLIGAGKPLEFSSFVFQLLAVLGLTVLAGRIFCGWACAFGTLNDIVYKLSQEFQRKTKIKFPTISSMYMRVLRYGKYLVLAGIIALCFFQKASFISPNSPWTAFSVLLSLNRQALHGCFVGIIILLLLLPGMAIKERFFCQCFCPMGAVFSILPTISAFQLKRKKENCPSRCGACQKICPVDILIDTENPHQGECIRCGKCAGICPKNNISNG